MIHHHVWTMRCPYSVAEAYNIKTVELHGVQHAMEAHTFTGHNLHRLNKDSKQFSFCYNSIVPRAL